MRKSHQRKLRRRKMKLITPKMMKMMLNKMIVLMIVRWQRRRMIEIKRLDQQRKEHLQRRIMMKPQIQALIQLIAKLKPSAMMEINQHNIANLRLITKQRLQCQLIKKKNLTQRWIPKDTKNLKRKLAYLEVRVKTSDRNCVMGHVLS